MSDSLRLHGLQHARLPCPSPTPGSYSNSCPLCQWFHQSISYSVAPLRPLPSIFLRIGFFQMSQFFASGGQIFGVSASASVLPMNIQNWFPLGLTSLISLLSKALFSITVQKHQFFGTQLSLMVQLSHPNMTTGKTTALTIAFFFPPTQNDGEEGCALIFSFENSKTATHCWTTINRRKLDPTKKRDPTSKGKG